MTQPYATVEDQKTQLQNHLDKIIFDVTYENVNGDMIHLAPLLQQINELTKGTTDGNNPNGTPGSRPPLWITGMDWLHRLNQTVKFYTKEFKLEQANTHDMALALHGHHYTPTDLPQLKIFTNAMKTLEHDGMNIIFPPLFAIKAPCPTCTETNTIMVTELWARCNNCNTTWEGEAIVTLAGDLTDDTDM